MMSAIFYVITERGKKRADEEWKKVDPKIREIIDRELEKIKERDLAEKIMEVLQQQKKSIQGLSKELNVDFYVVWKMVGKLEAEGKIETKEDEVEYKENGGLYYLPLYSIVRKEAVINTG